MTNPFITCFDDEYRKTGDPKLALNAALKIYITSRHSWLTGHTEIALDDELPGKLDDLRGVRSWRFNVQETIDKMKIAYQLIKNDHVDYNPEELHDGKLKELLIHAMTIHNNHLSPEEERVKASPHNQIAFVYSNRRPEEVLSEGLTPRDCLTSSDIIPSSQSVLAFPNRKREIKANYLYSISIPNIYTLQYHSYDFSFTGPNWYAIPKTIQPERLIGYRDTTNTWLHFEANPLRINPPVLASKPSVIFRGDERPPEVVFAEGFHSHNPSNPVRLSDYVMANQAGPYISFTREIEIAAKFPETLPASEPRWIYEIYERNRFLTDDEIKRQGGVMSASDSEKIAIGHVNPESVVRAHYVKWEGEKLIYLKTIENPKAATIINEKAPTETKESSAPLLKK